MLITILEFLLKATQFFMLVIFVAFALGVIVIMVSITKTICKSFKASSHPDFVNNVFRNKMIGKKLIYVWVLEFILGIVYLGIACILVYLKK
jgi:hypothetical protein